MTTQADLLVKCASQHCLFRKRVTHALENNEDIPPLCSYQVQFTCSSCGNPKMCGECYERMESRIITDLQSPMSNREVRKALWTTKYDMTKKHPLCMCICGGTLKAMLQGRHVVCVNVLTQDTENKKKKKKGKDWGKLRVIYTGDEQDGELDEEQQLFIYQRAEEKEIEHEAVQTLDDFTVQSFPAMETSPTRLTSPTPLHANVRQYVPFDMIIRNHGTFHTLIVPSTQHKLWMPRIIGKKGNGIRLLINTLADDDIRITKIHIDDVPSDSTIKRIVIAGREPDHREVCALKLYEDINGILRKCIV